LEKGCKAFVTDKSRSCFTRTRAAPEHQPRAVGAEQLWPIGLAHGTFLGFSKWKNLFENQTVNFVSLCALKLGDSLNK
jgi:hypothetical protein